MLTCLLVNLTTHFYAEVGRTDQTRLRCHHVRGTTYVTALFLAPTQGSVSNGASRKLHLRPLVVNEHLARLISKL